MVGPLLKELLTPEGARTGNPTCLSPLIMSTTEALRSGGMNIVGQFDQGP